MAVHINGNDAVDSGDLNGAARTIQTTNLTPKRLFGVLFDFSTAVARDINIILVDKDDSNKEYILYTAAADATNGTKLWQPSYELCMTKNFEVKVTLGATAGACVAKTNIIWKEV